MIGTHPNANLPNMETDLLQLVTRELHNSKTLGYMGWWWKPVSKVSTILKTTERDGERKRERERETDRQREKQQRNTRKAKYKQHYITAFTKVQWVRPYESLSFL